MKQKNRMTFLRVLPWIVSMAILLSYAVFLSLQSRNSPLACGYGWTDSGVFAYMAKLICNGGIPYVDCFDHKGPMLYLINVIGIIINEKCGIWVVELLFLFLTMICSFFLLKKENGIIAAIVSVLTSFALLVPYLQCGNLTEEYALLFQVVSLYCFMDYFLGMELRKKTIFIIGASFGVVLMLRPNLLFAWIPLCLFVFVDLILKRKAELVKVSIVFFLVGVFTVSIPIVVYLVLNGAFEQFIYDYLIFNLKYAGRNDIASIFDAASYFSQNIILKLAFIVGIIELCIMKTSKINEYNKLYKLYLLNMICLILAFIVVILPGNKYGHYMICLIPYMLLIFGFAVKLLIRMITRRNRESIFAIICFLLLGRHVLFPMFVEQSNMIISSRDNTSSNYEVVDYIKSNTNEDDTIIVTGINYCWIYYWSDRNAASRYAYRPIPMTEEMTKEYYGDIATNSPILIITTDQSIDVIKIFENTYSFETQIGGYFVYQLK